MSYARLFSYFSEIVLWYDFLGRKNIDIRQFLEDDRKQFILVWSLKGAKIDLFITGKYAKRRQNR